MIRFLANFFFIVLGILVLSGCKYRKGDSYVNMKSDSINLNYVILASGKGQKIANKATELKLNHDKRGNVCQISYLTDSGDLKNQKGVLLMHTALPEIENDILTGGFVSSFASKQEVSLLLVADQDFNKYFKPVEIKKK